MFGYVSLQIGSLFLIKNGYTPSTSNNEYWENGNIPWIRMEDIRKFGNILDNSLQHVTESAIKGRLFQKNSCIFATSATIGEHALVKVDFLCNQRFTCLTIKDEYKDFLLPKYVYYYGYIIDKWCLKNTTTSSFASVDMNAFKIFDFRFPSLQEQERIVSILDKFDSYCNDLLQGLPAEIEARHKQYEYYRDKLLKFKPLEK